MEVKREGLEGVEEQMKHLEDYFNLKLKFVTGLQSYFHLALIIQAYNKDRPPFKI
ncbi:hypothetical protein [Paenibacillus pectinilyticus]|uniref:hypothetical protein n=1 Tax=Paenibacillus pectinilyticus TaxID=512399 RepID=UPI001428A5C6|nr:hypothetical protein [Paenibacillus pectinilyticus]